MMGVDILLDALFSAVAGVGFGAISQPPRRAYAGIAILAALGHSMRHVLITVLGVDLATASLFAALCVGMGSLWLGRRFECPMTVLYIPALLPMIPGKIAYSAVFSLIMFLQSGSGTEQANWYMMEFMSNGLVSITVVFLLAVGATIPMFLFPSKAYSMTKRRR